jgi:hypothetical protein
MAGISNPHSESKRQTPMSRIANCTRQVANRNLRMRLAFGMMVLLAAGCGQSGPEVAPVKGRVTLDGRPLPNAVVQFQPDEGKRPSGGGTDENGEYELYYKRAVVGARVGQHTVRILTSANDPLAPVIPQRYNKQSELRREVKSGNNKFDFELTTKGD